MNNTFIYAIILIGIAVILTNSLINHLAYGVLCPWISQQDAFNHSPLVFSGLVINKTQAPNIPPVYVHFHIKEIFKGDYIPDTITIETQECGTQFMKPCGAFEFEQGKQYIVYTVGYPHVFAVEPFCTHTQLLTADTLDQTRKLALMYHLALSFEIVALLTAIGVGLFFYRKRKRRKDI